MAVGDQHSAAGENGTGHPSLEMLAAYADRALTAAEVAAIERHAADCTVCRSTLVDVSAFLASEQAGSEPGKPPATVTPFRRIAKPLVTLLAAAAVVTLVVRTVMPERLPWWLGGVPAGNRLATLVAAASTSPTRFTGGRLTGDFPYAPSPPVTRGTSEPTVSPEIRIAAAEVEQRIGAGDNAMDLAALGVARLAAGDWDRAVATLERAATMGPGDARIQNDLAVAYLARASNPTADYGQARAATERALASANPPVEALFNRAVALERLGLREEATQAWRDYLARDSSSPWANEARARAAALSPPTSSP